MWFADASALDEAHAALRQRLAALWQEVFEEDIAVVEGMQQGGHADAFDGRIFSPVTDEATAAFHGWLRERYRATAAAGG